MFVTQITKKLSEGHPNVVDVIRDGWVDGVINTITGERTPTRDGFAICRAAAEKRIPCFSSLDTAWAAVWAMSRRERHFNVLPMSRYLKRQ